MNNNDQQQDIPTPTQLPNPQVLEGVTDHEAKTYTLSSQEKMMEEYASDIVSKLVENPASIFQLPQYLPANANIPHGIREAHSKILNQNPKKKRIFLRKLGAYMLSYEGHRAEAITRHLLKQDAPTPFKESIPVTASRYILTYLGMCIPPEFKKAILQKRLSSLTPSERYLVKLENDKLAEARKTQQEEMQRKLDEQLEKLKQFPEEATLQTPDGQTIKLSQEDMARMVEAKLLPPPGTIQPEDEGYEAPSKILDPSGKPASHEPTNILHLPQGFDSPKPETER